MRNALLTTAALLGLAAGPAFAQMSPAPNSTEPSDPTLPGTSARVPGRSGMGMGADGGMSGDGMTGMRPMRGQQNFGTRAETDRPMRPMRPMQPAPAARASRAPMNDMDSPPTGQYRGGAGSPSSQSASNITAADTRSEIAPRLPDPGAGGNSPEAYMAAAQRALASGRTGAAQEALERAETRLLTRSTEPGMASSPSDMPMVRQISDARRALANRDTAGARAALGPMQDSGMAPMRGSPR